MKNLFYIIFMNFLFLCLVCSWDIAVDSAKHHVKMINEVAELKSVCIEVVEKTCEIGGITKNAGGITANIRSRKYQQAIELIQKLPASRRERTDAENLKRFGLVKYEWKYADKFGYPVEDIEYAYVTQEYSLTHWAMDIMHTKKSNIIAIQDAQVYQIGTDWRAGRYIILLHKFGSEYWFSSYAHLNSLKAKLHAFVLKGEIIGEMGSTGEWQTGRHLHFCLSKRFGKTYWTRNPVSNAVRKQRIYTKSFVGVM